MNDNELLTEREIHAFGMHILIKKLEEDGWIIESADPDGDRATHPQLIGHKDGEIGFFVVRTAMYPGKGRIEGEEVFQNQVLHANKHGAVCYFASIGLASAAGESEEAKSTPVKGVHYHISFDGLVRMSLPESDGKAV
jgi:hypothetical protein